jgi:hypothetical protein
MRQDINITKMYVSDYDNQIMPNYESSINEVGSSQVLEPEIIMPIYTQSQNPVRGTTITSIEEIEPILSEQVVENTPVKSGSTEVKPQKDSESSATTDETKTYVGGGTTPDSQIVVKKPMTKYYIYGILGIVGALVVYKVFFNKKTA